MIPKGSYILHWSEVRQGYPQIEVMVVYPNDPDDDLTETICLIEGHTEEARRKADLVLIALKELAENHPASVPRAVILSTKGA